MFPARRSVPLFVGILFVSIPCCVVSLIISPLFQGSAEILKILEAIRTLTGVDLMSFFPGGTQVATTFIRDLPPVVSASLCLSCLAGCCFLPIIGGVMIFRVIVGRPSVEKQQQFTSFPQSSPPLPPKRTPPPKPQAQSRKKKLRPPLPRSRR